MRKIRILYSTINVTLIITLFLLYSYTNVNNVLFSITFYIMSNILLIVYFNYFRRVKCNNCGEWTSIKRQKNNRLICDKCNNKIDVDIIEIGTDDVIP